MNVNLELSELEVKVLVAALDRYRIAKSAEKMLRTQALKNKEEWPASFARYDALLQVITTIQGKVT